MSQYYGVVRSEEELYHHGVKGMHWGVRKMIDRRHKEHQAKRVRDEWLDRQIQKAKEEAKIPQRVFVSGSSKTQDKTSPYYRRRLPKDVRRELKFSMKKGDQFLVGDAPGIDRQVQDYLKKKRYSNVEVYGPGKQVRYAADSKWKTRPINAPEYPEGSKEWLAKKDIAMTNKATRGIAVILDEGSSATRKNVHRMIDQKKKMNLIYELNPRPKGRLVKGFQEPADQQVINYYDNKGNQYFKGMKHNRKAKNATL